jgi:23S rRNA (cytidine1920-2'-O)/16S rRNA (cytidine1409-2'-O)-methyltransferase
MEETNARHLTAEMIPDALDVIVCDASFISLTKVLPAALALAKPAAQLVTLIKPQFEVGKVEVSRGKGVIRDAKLHQQVCDDISAWVSSLGWKVIGITTSPITGPKGNVEFLLYARKEV